MSTADSRIALAALAWFGLGLQPPGGLGNTCAASVQDELTASLRSRFEELAEAGLSGAVLVARGDEVLLDAAYGLADRAHSRVNRPDTIFDIGSITKQFTATAILQLQERKKLATTDTLERFFDAVPADKKHVQLHHLLTHTSGLPPDLPVGSATSERDALVRAALKAELRSKPGEEFVYNNVGYMLLAAVVEIVSKQTFESYVAEHLFAPAGMQSSGFLRTPGVDTNRTARGYEGKTAFGPAEQGWYSWGLRGAGGVLSTTGDLLRWSRALASDDILAKPSRERLFTPFLLGYAYGWWVRDDPLLGRVTTHGGTTRGFEASLAQYSDHDLCVIVLCNDRGRAEATARALAEIAAGKRASDANVILAEAELQAFAGEYDALRGGTVVVRVEGQALVVEPDTAAVVGLVAERTNAALDDDQRLEKRATKLIDFLAAGDADGAQTFMSKQWPNWNRQMIKVWESWIDARGRLEKVEHLGSLGPSTTLVRLVHERRSVVWVLHWKDNVLDHWSIDGRIPEAAHFRACSDAQFAYEEAEGPAPTKFSLSFERDAAGKVRALSLAGPFVQLAAKRSR